MFQKNGKVTALAKGHQASWVKKATLGVTSESLKPLLASRLELKPYFLSNVPCALLGLWLLGGSMFFIQIIGPCSFRIGPLRSSQSLHIGHTIASISWGQGGRGSWQTASA